MATRWHDKLTPLQQKRMEWACRKAYHQFGSYTKVAQALTEETGHKISHETIRGYLKSHQVPVHIAATLSELTEGVTLFDFVPWLPTYCGGITK